MYCYGSYVSFPFQLLSQRLADKGAERMGAFFRVRKPAAQFGALPPDLYKVIADGLTRWSNNSHRLPNLPVLKSVGLLPLRPLQSGCKPFRFEQGRILYGVLSRRPLVRCRLHCEA